jgi:hypothetical protein
MRHIRDITDRDRYNRLLQYVCVGKIFINAELLRFDHARPMTIAPNVRHQALFRHLRRQARRSCNDFVGLMARDLRRRARREKQKLSPWADRIVRLVDWAPVKVATPAECVAVVERGLSPRPENCRQGHGGGSQASGRLIWMMGMQSWFMRPDSAQGSSSVNCCMRVGGTLANECQK